MSLSRETQEMLQNAITKMASKYISAEESNVTDFHLKVNGENGELTIFDDDDNTLARVHIIKIKGLRHVIEQRNTGAVAVGH